MIRSLFEWLEAMPTSTALRESLNGFPITLTAHVVFMCLFLGLIIVMDLRLAGFGFRQTPFSEVQRRLWPWQAFGFVVTSITGFLLFYSQPMRYYGKLLFWIKIVLMALAGVNALYFAMSLLKILLRLGRFAPK